jgi:hypothetical protein
VRCQEQVLEYCSRGHLVVRRCCEAASAPCGTCSSILKVQLQQKRELELLVGGGLPGVPWPFCMQPPSVRWASLRRASWKQPGLGIRGVSTCVLQEREAARKRAAADLERAKVTGDMQRLQQALEAMQQARAERQAAVAQELERQKLQLQVELQVGGCWLGCWAAGLLGCWAAGLLGCWAAGLPLGCCGAAGLQQPSAVEHHHPLPPGAGEVPCA